MDIHRRSQPDGNIVLFYLRGCRGSHPGCQLRVPSSGQQGGAGPGGGADTYLGLDAQTGGAVGGGQVGDTVLREIAQSKGVGHSHIGLSAQQMDQVIVAELGHKLLQGQLSLRHGGQGLYSLGKGLGQHPAPPPGRGGGHRLRLSRGEGLEQVGIGVHRRGGGQLLIAPVCQQAFSQVGRGQDVPTLTDCLCLLLFPGPVQLPGVPDGGPHVQGVPPLLQHPGGGGDLPQIIEAGHIGNGKGQLHCLRFSWLQQRCLLEGRQTAPRLLEQPPGGGVIELDHLFPRTSSRVGHLDVHPDSAVFRPGPRRLQGKAGVGQAVAEGVTHPLRRSRQRLKIPVAHIDVLAVLHIVGGVMEAGGGGVVGQVPGEGVGQLAAGIGFAGEQGGNGPAPLHAPLPGQQGGGNTIILAEPGDVHHAARIEHHRHLVKSGADLVYHALFFSGEVVVPPGKDVFGLSGHIQLVGPGVVRLLIEDRLPVPALAGEAAEDDHGHVRVPPGRIHQTLGQLRLGHQAGDVPRLIPPLHIVPVKIGQWLIEGYPLLLQAVIHIFDIGHGHIPAAAAALHIVEAALAEQGHPGIGSQREQISVVFQQHRPLLGSPAGQGDVLRTGCHTAVAFQGQIGLIAGANPFFHKKSSLKKAPSADGAF